MSIADEVIIVVYVVVTLFPGLDGQSAGDFKHDTGRNWVLSSDQVEKLFQVSRYLKGTTTEINNHPSNAHDLPQVNVQVICTLVHYAHSTIDKLNFTFLFVDAVLFTVALSKALNIA